MRWVLGGVLLGLALSGLGPDATPNSSRLGADGPDSSQLPEPGGFLPFGFRASAANRASGGATVETLVPFGGVPRARGGRARGARRAALARRSARGNNDDKSRAGGSGSNEARASSFRDGLARWITRVVACLSLFLPVTRSMIRWPTPLFLLGTLGIVVFALVANNALGSTRRPAVPRWGADRHVGKITPLFDGGEHSVAQVTVRRMCSLGMNHDVVAKIEVSNPTARGGRRRHPRRIADVPKR